MSDRNANDLLRSDLQGCCDADCSCADSELSQAEYCSYCPLIANFKSSCKDKAASVECGPRCKCGPGCKNRPITSGEEMKIEKDVVLKLCWGVDLFTRKNIFFLTPSFLSNDERLQLVNQIIRELNSSGIDGWDITNAVLKLLSKLRQ